MAQNDDGISDFWSDTIPRDIPLKAAGNLRRRYRRMRLLAYFLTFFITVDYVRGERDIGPIITGLTIAAIIWLATRLYGARALNLARNGHIVDARITQIRGYAALGPVVKPRGMVDVKYEFDLDGSVYEGRKSIFPPVPLEVGTSVQMVVDPHRPGHRMWLHDLAARMAKS